VISLWVTGDNLGVTTARQHRGAQQRPVPGVPVADKLLRQQRQGYERNRSVSNTKLFVVEPNNVLISKYFYESTSVMSNL
jgi:hypothetical protein